MLSLPPDRNQSDTSTTQLTHTKPTRPARPAVAAAQDEKRAWPRAQVDLPVQVLRRAGEPAQTYVAENISAGGAMLTHGPALEVGSVVQILMLLGRRTLTLTASVVRNQPQPGLPVGSAVRFLDLSSKLQDDIQSYVLSSIRRRASRRKSGTP